MLKNKYEQIRNQNILYYDKIASNYDSILNSNKKNDFIRGKIAYKLTTHLKKGVVLDFGGGTGQDLNWMSKNNYKVIFCEPSSEMRQVAIKKHENEFPNLKIDFLEDSKTDFTIWDNERPFQEKADAVIANFAVLNCILNIDLFFKNLALVTSSNSTIILLVLDYSFKKKLKINYIETLKSFFMKKCMNIKIEFEGENQLVYVHSIKSIKNAAKNDFSFKEVEPIKEYDFSIIHLIRK